MQPYNYEVGSSDCEGSDWRDFPNKVVELSDGKMCKKLHYFYEDNMSVPLYCEGKCNPKDNQKNILVLWDLPYTTNRQKTLPNSTAGWTRTVFFSITITNPEPMGKQGWVRHPNQNRLVSVQECAMPQGFPKTFRFFESV